LNQIAHGKAVYRQGEVHRLRGDLGAAEEAYREASRLGCEPQPGLALLRLAQGDSAAAAAAIRRVIGETTDRLKRAALLSACVEIMLGVGDVEEARSACSELEEIAAGQGNEMLGALSAHARGALMLAEGDPPAALLALRDAQQAWRELDVPYEVARVRALTGMACRALGDDDGAELELDAARSAFAELGATPDVALVASLTRLAALALPGGLTAREVEVLGLVAKGGTNRDIAQELVISEKTVASHVSHIFTKLGLTSRAAATAYAYEHGLL
jgi:DNA-binding NarL/FixJ family response regulator